MDKKEFQKRILSIFLLIMIPIVVGLMVGLFIKIPVLYLVTAVYAILLFFMIPSNVFSRSSLDYTIKSVNPTYKHELPKIGTAGTKNQLINFFVIMIMLAICLLIVFLTTS